MTNTNKLTLVEYNQELAPKLRRLFELKEAVKEWVAEDETAQDFVREAKEMNENLKSHVEDKNPGLIREIKDIELDVKLACKSAAKNTDYTPAEIKSYLVARAKEAVQKTLDKAVLFEELELELV